MPRACFVHALGEISSSRPRRCRGAHVDAQGFPRVADAHSALRNLARVRGLLDHTRAFGKCLEIADAKANAASWARWLQDRAARGGRDVHRFSRVPGGWVPSQRVPHEDDYWRKLLTRMTCRCNISSPGKNRARESASRQLFHHRRNRKMTRRFVSGRNSGVLVCACRRSHGRLPVARRRSQQRRG